MHFYILKLCVLITYMLLRFLKFLSVRCIYVKAFICFLFNLYKLLFGMQSFTSIRFCNFSKFLTKYRCTAVGHGGSIGSNLLFSKVFFCEAQNAVSFVEKNTLKNFILLKWIFNSKVTEYLKIEIRESSSPTKIIFENKINPCKPSTEEFRTNSLKSGRLITLSKLFHPK